MLTGIIGRKVGMTQVFAADGTVTPATVIKAGPCVVTQAKSAQSDGYEAVQVGLVEDRPARVNKPTAGAFKKANVPPTRLRRELKVAKGAEAPKPGDQILVNAVFNNGDRVDVIGVSRGKGFQGVVKGMRAAGRMGGDRVTVRNLKVVSVDAENNLLVIRGAIPGAPGGYVVVRKAIAAKPEPQVQAEKASKVQVAKKPKK